MMKNLKAYALLVVLCFAFSADISAQQPANGGHDPNVTVSEVMKIYPVGKVNLSEVKEDWWPEMRNTWVAPRPGTDVDQDIQNELKRIAAELTEASGTPSAKVTGPEDTLSLQGSFFGNGYDGGIPNDNSIAVGKGQKVVSVANSTIRTYQGSSSVVQYQASLAGFASGQGGSATKYDPKVTYDPLRDRFIVVFLNGFLASNSLIVVGFSESEDPAGNWFIYTLDGSVTSNTWTDFPQIAISNTELFITGNRFTDAGQAQGSVIWQVGLDEGYNNQPLNSRFFSATYFSLHPVEGGYRPYGDNMYFIRTVSNPIPTSKSFFVHEMTGTIAAGGVLNSPVALNSDLSYGVAPDANQKGTTLKLDGNDCRVQTSFYENSRIECAFNTNSGGKPAVYRGSITLSPSGLAFSSVKGQHIKFDSLEILYPGIAPGGCVSASGENSVVVMFNFSSVDHNPGNAAVFIDTLDNIGPPKMLKYGFTYMGDDGSPSPWRWGDYADAFPRQNNPGEIWIGGSVGMMSSGQHRNGTWISKVFSPCCLGPIGIEEVNVSENPTVTAYPVPANDLIFFNIGIPKTGIYKVSIVDVQGRVVKELVEDRYKEGNAQLRFTTSLLDAGLYFVRIESEVASPMTRSFVVAH